MEVRMVDERPLEVGRGEAVEAEVEVVERDAIEVEEGEVNVLVAGEEEDELIQWDVLSAVERQPLVPACDYRLL